MNFNWSLLPNKINKKKNRERENNNTSNNNYFILSKVPLK